MFQLVADRTVKNWPAKITVPLDGGKVEAHDVTFDFKLVDSERFAEISRKGDAEMFAEVIIGWGGIADKDASPLPFTPDNLKAACRNQPFIAGAYAAYMRAVSGQASEKN